MSAALFPPPVVRGRVRGGFRRYVHRPNLLPAPGLMKMPGNAGGFEDAGVRHFVALDGVSSPSPGTPGEGRGEGLLFLPPNERTLTLTLSRSTGRGLERNGTGTSNTPTFSSAHPFALPEYRGRQKNRPRRF